MKTGYKVADAMTHNPVMVTKETNLEQCAKVMDEKRVAGLIVGTGDKLEGVLTEKDIVRKVVAKGTNPLNLHAKDVMSLKPITIEPDKDIFEAIVLMRDKNIRHLPVVFKGKLQGVLTMKDILKIEPQLFEIIVEKFSLREEANKPVRSPASEGLCEYCGEYTDDLRIIKGSRLCQECARTA